MSLQVQRGTKLNIKKLLFSFAAVFALVAQPMYGVVASYIANAASDTTTVRTGEMNGWTVSAASGGAATLVGSNGAPLGTGALQLTTVDDNNSRTSLTKAYNIPLADIDTLSFQSKQISSLDTRNGNITMRVNVDTNGDGTMDDQLMFEPYYNGFNGTTMSGWQTWNVKNGKFWSNYRYAYNGLGAVGAGSPASNFTLTDVLHDYADTKVVGIALSMGTWNRLQVVQADNVKINDETVNFETDPTFDSLAPAYWKNTYKGINVDIRVSHLTDATGVEVKVDRSSGGPYVQTLTPAALATYNVASTNASGQKSLTAPIVIQRESYTGGSSWNMPSTPWTAATLPTNVTVTITRANGSTLVMSKPLGESTGSGARTVTRAEVMPANQAPVGSVTSPVNGDTAGTANGKLVVKGLVNDDLGQMNYVYAQLVKPGVSGGLVQGYHHMVYQNPGAWEIELNVKNLGLTDGAYGLNIKYMDMQGNMSEERVDFVIDNTYPTFAINNPANGSFVRGTVNLKAEIKDEKDISKVLMNIGGISRSWNEGASTTITQTGDIFSTNVDTTTLPDGAVYTTLRGTDGNGNVRYWNNNANTRQHVFYVDNTAPEVGLVAPTGATKANSVEVKGWATDEHMRYYACYITTNQPITAFGKNWTAGQEPKSGASNDQSLADPDCVTKWTSADVGSSTSPVVLGSFDIAGLPDGSYTIHMHAHDLAGNQNEATTTFTIDRSVPKVSNISIVPRINNNVGGIVTVEFDLEDATSVDLTKTRVLFADGPNTSNAARESAKFTPVLVSGNTYKVEINTRDFVKDNWTGTYSLTFNLWDTLGNQGSSKPAAFRPILIDNSGPIYVSSNINTGDFLGKSDSKVFTVDFDDHTGVVSAKITLKNTTTGQQRDVTLSENSDGSWSGDMSAALTLLGDGVYDFSIRPVDSFGRPRSNTTAVKNVTVDTIAPVVKIHNPANGEELTGPVDIIASIADDNLSHYWLTITKDGSDVNLPNTKKYMYTDEFSNETIATLSAPGVYVVKLEARDKAGNKDGGSIATTTFTIIEDNDSEEPTDPVDPVDPTDPTEPPVVTITEISRNLNGTYIITVTTSNADDTVQLWLDGVEILFPEIDGTTRYFTTAVLADGLYEVEARAIDNEGRDSGLARDFFVVNVGGTGLLDDADLLAPTEEEEADDTDTVAALFFPATFGGANLGGTSATTTTPLTPTTTTDAGSDDSGILGATDDNTSWSIVNAALAGFVAILAVVALAGIRRGKEDNNTGARVFMIVPAAAAVIAFFVIESVGGSMIWFNVWTWLFGGILVVQAIVATLTTRTAND